MINYIITFAEEHPKALDVIGFLASIITILLFIIPLCSFILKKVSGLRKKKQLQEKEPGKNEDVNKENTILNPEILQPIRITVKNYGGNVHIHVNIYPDSANEETDKKEGEINAKQCGENSQFKWVELWRRYSKRLRRSLHTRN